MTPALRASLAFATLSALATFAPRAAAQSVHVVDEVPGAGDFQTIQAAVDAAQDGDTILVRTGTYPSFVVDQRSLAIAADSGAEVTISMNLAKPIRVRNVAASQSVSLHGLRVIGANESNPFITSEPLLQVIDCAGPVLLQDCTLLHGDGVRTLDGIRVVRSQALTLVDCVLDLSAPISSIQAHPGTALDTDESNVFLHGCTVESSEGPKAQVIVEPPGRDGLIQRGGLVAAIASELRGGRGGMGVPFFHDQPCVGGGPGGAGASLRTGSLGSLPELVLIDSALIPGAGGPSGFLPGETIPAGCEDGVEGVPSDVQAGAITLPGLPARRLAATGVVPDHSTLVLDLSGAPSDFAVLFFNVFANNPIWVPDVAGVLYPAPPLFSQVAGLLDATGHKQLTYFSEDQGFPVVPIYMQSFHVTADLSVHAANARLILLLDE